MNTKELLEQLTGQLPIVFHDCTFQLDFQPPLPNMSEYTHVLDKACNDVDYLEQKIADSDKLLTEQRNTIQRVTCEKKELEALLRDLVGSLIDWREEHGQGVPVFPNEVVSIKRWADTLITLLRSENGHAMVGK